MKLRLILSDTDAIRQFSPEDTPRAGRKMQARKASQGSKGIKQRGMKDLMKGLQDCGEIGSLFPLLVEVDIAAASLENRWAVNIS